MWGSECVGLITIVTTLVFIARGQRNRDGLCRPFISFCVTTSIMNGRSDKIAT